MSDKVKGAVCTGGALLLAAASLIMLLTACLLVVRAQSEEDAYRGALATVIDSAGTLDGEALAERWPHAAAWLTVKNTAVSYPVARLDTGMPDSFYLSHDIDGEPSSAGALYLDPRFAADGAHIAVYGHRMGRSRRMFGDLATRARPQAFRELGCAYWYEPGQSQQVFEPLCALEVEARYAPIQRFTFTGSDDLRAWLTEIAATSSARAEDWEKLAHDARRVLTLITCTEANGHAAHRTLVLFVSSGTTKSHGESVDGR